MTTDLESANYQKKSSNGTFNTQYEMAKGLELTFDNFRDLKLYCDSKDILFMSTPDEEVSAIFLNEIQDIFKIGSGEVNNIPFLRLIGSFRKKVILSTGMSTLRQISNALEALISSGTSREDITILQANSQYPTPMKDINLRAMHTIQNAFDIDVGLSDHTIGIEVPIAAVAMGAKVIEKHFTLDKDLSGPDHLTSLNPVELKSMVQCIRNIEEAFGSGHKLITSSEQENISAFRKSIVAKVDIQKGETFTIDSLAVKRSAKGVSPEEWDNVIGSISTKQYKKDEVIDACLMEK